MLSAGQSCQSMLFVTYTPPADTFLQPPRQYAPTRPPNRKGSIENLISGPAISFAEPQSRREPVDPAILTLQTG